MDGFGHGVESLPSNIQNGDAHMLGGEDPLASEIDRRGATEMLDHVIPTRVRLRRTDIALSSVVVEDECPGRACDTEENHGQGGQKSSRLDWQPASLLSGAHDHCRLRLSVGDFMGKPLGNPGVVESTLAQAA